MSLALLHGKLDVLSTRIETTTLLCRTESEICSHQARKLGSMSARGMENIRTICKTINKNFWVLRISTPRRENTVRRGGQGSSTREPDSPVRVWTMNIFVRMGYCRKGLRMSVTGQFDTWCLNPIRHIPNDSPIFRAIGDGDIVEVQKLLDLGKASVYDVDEDGDSLLHVSVAHMLAT